MVMNKPLIFLCDDDRDIVEVVTILLREKFTIEVFYRCEGIISAAEARQPSVILLDLRMPLLGGRETLVLLKANKPTRKIPVILFSATNDLARCAREAGADAWLEKPFDIDRLCSMVEDFACSPRQASA